MAALIIFLHKIIDCILIRYYLSEKLIVQDFIIYFLVKIKYLIFFYQKYVFFCCEFVMCVEQKVPSRLPLYRDDRTCGTGDTKLYEFVRLFDIDIFYLKLQAHMLA